MSDANRKLDPFKPPMPRIPGVPERPRQAHPRTWLWVCGSVGVLAVGAGIAWWTLRSSHAAPSAKPEQEVPASTNSAPAAPAAGPRDGRLEVATIEELSRPWSYKRFAFGKRLTDEMVPAIVVRLPGGIGKTAQSYWAFSLEAPFTHCQLEYVTDLTKIARDYGYRAEQPMVVSPCDFTVYDPLGYASVAGAWVRGQVVQGPGVRPPFAIEVRVEGNRILATQME